MVGFCKSGHIYSFAENHNILFGFQIQNSIQIIEGLDNIDLYNWSPNVYTIII